MVYILWYHLTGMSTQNSFSNTILMNSFCKILMKLSANTSETKIFSKDTNHKHPLVN